MASELATIQIHIWILAGVVGALVLGNILYKLTPFAASREAERLQGLCKAEKFSELLAHVDVGLRDAPASPMFLMHKVYALLGLGRIREAECAAHAFKKATPERRPTAIGLIDLVTDLRAKLAEQHIAENELPALMASHVGVQ